MDETRSALIVASDEFTDPGLRRLRAPASDARALAGVLQDPSIGGFQVHTLLNQPAHEVTLAVEEFFADRRPDDLLLLHVSGHGVKDEDGELYFATSNTRLRRLGATAVAAEFVNRRMNRSRSRRVVLLLDCCYAGAFERGMTARAGSGVAIHEQFGGRGRVVITASSAMEYAFEGDQLADTQELSPSVFTNALVEGLETGEADRDQDGLVALGELYDFVYDKVRSATPNQTPGKWMFGVQGELVIARRARPVTTPASLPPELQQAIDHPLAAVRAGAVQELARLLQSKHQGLALAARLTLERLTEDDSRAVSAAAAAALGTQTQPPPAKEVPPEAEPRQPAPTEETPPEPAPIHAVPPEALPAQLLPAEEVPPEPAPRLELSTTVVDFGRLLLDSEPSPQRIQVKNTGGGSLNARIATVPAWIQAEHVGDDLILAVSPNRIGSLAGEVVVESQAGSASVRVTAQVDPPVARAAEPAPADLGQPIADREASPQVTAQRSADSSPARADGTPSSQGADDRGHYQGHALATRRNRLLARLIDWVPLLIILLVTRNALGGVVALLTDLYNRAYLGGVNGQSWGQRALRLKLVRMTDNLPIGLPAGLIRELAYLVSIFLYGVVALISWVFAIWDARRQTLGDRIMHTVVLSESTEPSRAQGAATQRSRRPPA